MVSRLKEELNKIKEQEPRAIETITLLTETLESQENARMLPKDKWEKHLTGLTLRTGTNPRTVPLIFPKVDRIKIMIQQF